MDAFGTENKAGPGDSNGTHRHSGDKRRLKVLVLDEEIPFPANSGKRIRTWNLLRRLAARHCVSLLCYGHADNSGVEALRQAGIKAHLVRPKVNPAGWRLYLLLFLNLFSRLPFSVTKHSSSEFRQRLRALLAQESWDLVQCEWTPYAHFVARGCRVPVLISTHNVESQIWERRKRNAGNLIAKAFFWTQEQKMRRFERRALLHASGVTAVTAGDEQLHRDDPSANTRKLCAVISPSLAAKYSAAHRWPATSPISSILHN